MAFLHNSHPGMIGNPWGNAIFKYLVFQELVDMIDRDDLLISNFEFPDWKIWHKSIERNDQFESLQREGSYLKLGSNHFLDRGKILDFANGKQSFVVDLPGYYFRAEYLPDANRCREFFPVDHLILKDEHRNILEDCILCPVRAAEILKPIHPHYTLIPPKYYMQIQEESGKNIIFCGQIGGDQYSQSLVNAVPNAMIINKISPYYDFQFCMQAKQIVLPISTFAWMAAFLSNAERIYMPIAGIFNPKQYKDPNFVVKGDSRYIYDEFSIYHSSDLTTLLNRFSNNEISWKRLTAFA